MLKIVPKLKGHCVWHLNYLKDGFVKKIPHFDFQTHTIVFESGFHLALANGLY